MGLNVVYVLNNMIEFLLVTDLESFTHLKGISIPK